jgi:hypothetical protein
MFRDQARERSARAFRVARAAFDGGRRRERPSRNSGRIGSIGPFAELAAQLDELPFTLQRVDLVAHVRRGAVLRQPRRTFAGPRAIARRAQREPLHTVGLQLSRAGLDSLCDRSG